MKQTEIGLIPDDWEVKKLGNITTHVDYRGKTPKKTNMGIQLITAKNIRMGYIDYKNNQEFVSPTDYSEVMKRGLPQKGDVLITTEAPAGNVAQIDNENIALAQRVIKYRGNETLNNDYLCHYFLSDCFQNLLRAMNTGGTVQGIKGSLLHTLPVIVPPLAEQQRIAKALSDVDALISTIELLIQKKKNIKQGTMQNLLTGKKRLPGFAKSNKTKITEIGEIPADWEVKELGEIATFQGGSQPDISFFSNIKKKNYIRLIQIRDYKTDKYKTYIPISLARRFCSKDDIMIGRYGPPIFQILRGLAGAYNVALIKTEPNNVIKEFYYYVLNDFKLFSFIELLSRRSSGQTGVDLYELKKYKIPFPPSKEEQTAIANVLTSMDKEIESLNTKLEKYRNIKTAMMQQLLTGKIRLFASETAEAISDKKQRAPNPFFKRSVLAAEIVDRLHDEPTFGHVKLQKLIFLAERMCGIDIDSSYHRDAAGPYDNYGLRSIDSQLEKQKWFSVEHTENAYHYIPLENQGGHKQYFERYFADKQDTFDLIIKKFKTAKTEQCEIVATLYSAWEDFLKKGITPTDDQIITEVLTNWHESKTRIEKSRWISALNWMKENGFVPQV